MCLIYPAQQNQVVSWYTLMLSNCGMCTSDAECGTYSPGEHDHRRPSPEEFWAQAHVYVCSPQPSAGTLLNSHAQGVWRVGAGTCVYLWSAATSRVVKLCELGTGAAPDSVCSVAWSGRGSYLAIGTNSNETQIWDANKSQL